MQKFRFELGKIFLKKYVEPLKDKQKIRETNLFCDNETVYQDPAWYSQATVPIHNEIYGGKKVL